MPGKITFALADYHHSANLSLPSSEWDRVGQFEVNTKQIKYNLRQTKSQIYKKRKILGSIRKTRRRGRELTLKNP